MHRLGLNGHIPVWANGGDRGTVRPLAPLGRAAGQQQVDITGYAKGHLCLGPIRAHRGVHETHRRAPYTYTRARAGDSHIMSKKFLRPKNPPVPGR